MAVFKNMIRPGNSKKLFLFVLLLIETTSAQFYMRAARRRQHLRDDDLPPPLTVNPHLEKIDTDLALCNGVDIRELTILEIQDLFAAGKLTSVQLTRCYIERIQAMNEVLHCVNELNKYALVDAALADEERNEGFENLGLMHGIPILLKENMGTGDMMETTAGALALLGIRTKHDADVVKAVKKSGAIILGKANLSEFAKGTNIPSGWSGRGNQTRNPYNLNVTPSGSSSGPAVTVAANLVAVSLGTETDGSIISPSNVNGICGLKPTHGISSLNGVIPISHKQDHIGPMARTVTDLAILLDAIVPLGTRHFSYPRSFTNACQEPVESPLRVGIMRYPFFNTSAIDSPHLVEELPELNKLIDALKNSNEVEVFDNLNPSISLLSNVSSDAEFLALKHEFKHDFNDYLHNDVYGPYHLSLNSTNQDHGKIKSLKDVIQYNLDHPDPEGYNQEILLQAEKTDGLENKTYIEARESVHGASKKVLDSILVTYDLDAVLVPSEARFESILDNELTGGYSGVLGQSLACIAGYPSMNVPAGVDSHGVPFGINIIGLPYTEVKLLQIGKIIEALFPRRVSPKFLL